MTNHAPKGLRLADQERAQKAWQVVGPNPGDDYVNLAKSAPALIMQNGLMQTLAFFQSKGNQHGKLLRHICSWLVERKVVRAESSSFKDVMEALMACRGHEYRRATEEALEFLKWVRHFAAARSGG